MNSEKSVEERVGVIEERNRKVETDKMWETSTARKAVIALLTYIVIVIFFFAARLPDPFVNSIVPTLGFILSTLSLPLFKKLWIKKVQRGSKAN